MNYIKEFFGLIIPRKFKIVDPNPNPQSGADAPLLSDQNPSTPPLLPTDLQKADDQLLDEYIEKRVQETKSIPRGKQPVSNN